MGDTGSLVCGFIIAVLAIKFTEMRPVENTAALSVSILFIPIFDTARVFILRILSGKSPFAPDKSHVHHQMLEMGVGQITVVIILSAVNVLVFVFAITLTSKDQNILIGLIGLFMVAITIAIELLERKRAKLNLHPKA
jgi:UDP-N-acetylmuramyl pentapeptide phosphotransferase/UDP-N-acetylglucosamine-1-phosphate transferase